MKNVPLWICDTDDIYTEKLAAYIMRRTFSPFMVKTIEDINDAYLAAGKDGLLVIASDSLSRVDKGILDPERTVILNEGRIDKGYYDYPMINKYQAATGIYEYLLQCQIGLDDQWDEKGKTVHKSLEIRGIYSPVHRLGKSQYSINLSKVEGQNHKVLLLNLEMFPKERAEGMSLSDLIYYYKQDKIQAAFDMPNLIRHHDLYDDILPVRCALDLQDMTEEDWIVLIERIELLGVYDLLVIDFDVLPEFGLMDKCKILYLPYLDEPGELNRVEVFENLLSMLDNFNIAEKIEKVCMEG